MVSKSSAPPRWVRAKLADVMDGKANCHVSGRWLQFPDAARENYVGGDIVESLMIIDVMTADAEGKPRKLCELVLAREDLLSILTRMRVIPQRTE